MPDVPIQEYISDIATLSGHSPYVNFKEDVVCDACRGNLLLNEGGWVFWRVLNPCKKYNFDDEDIKDSIYGAEQWKEFISYIQNEYGTEWS